MKPTATIDMKRTGDFGGTKVAMGLDPDSAAHIMALLTDLYSDPELAVVREYSTNARDAHIMAGVTKPIEVSLPNPMSPFFKVKDYGLGLSVTDIEQIYSQYGASTKRGTNDANGMLGLGCKSALTYTNQFTITAVKDGMKSIVVVSRVEDGTGVMEIIDTIATTEVNSVEISVPAKRNHTFARTARDFYRFWDAGTVLVDGVEPNRLTGNKVGPRMMTVTDGLSSDVIVMGGVAYPVDNLYAGHRDYYNMFNVVAFVEIGEVNFTPSREALQHTKLTDQTITALRTEFTQNLHSTVRADVDSAPTHAEALDRLLKWERMLSRSMPTLVTYKGQTIERDFTVAFNAWHRNRSRNTMSQGATLNYKTIMGGIFVTGFDLTKTLSPRNKKKLTILMTNMGINVYDFILVDTEVGAPWVTPKAVIKWEDVLAYKLPKSGPREVKAPTFLVYTTAGRADDVEVDDIDDQTPIYYISPKHRKHYQTLVALTSLLGDASIIVAGENRWKRIKEIFPTALPLDDAVTNLIAESTKALTAADRQNLGMDYYDKALLSRLNENDIDDPAIKDGIKTAHGLTTTTTMTTYAKVAKVAGEYGFYIPSISAPSILDDYPLAKHGSNTKHVILYINAVFAASKNGAI